MRLAKTTYFRTRTTRLSLALFMLITLSCQNESRKSTTEEIQGDPAPTIAEGVEAPLAALPYVAVFNEESEQLEAERNPEFNRTLLTVDAMTQALRTNYPEIALEINRVSNDTLFVQIADARYLTQQMGSSGAQIYILEATYAYTELPEITVVHFDFAEGDHAIPGNYSRENFN